MLFLLFSVLRSGAGRHLIGEAYWSGLPIVPVVLAAYLFYGIYINLTAGPSIQKQTKWLTQPWLCLMQYKILKDQLLSGFP